MVYGLEGLILCATARLLRDKIGADAGGVAVSHV